jgi:hypothetical protein
MGEDQASDLAAISLGGFDAPSDRQPSRSTASMLRGFHVEHKVADSGPELFHVERPALSRVGNQPIEDGWVVAEHHDGT